MQRIFLIRRIIRDVLGTQPNNDTNMSDNFVNALLNEGIAIAIKNNWKESIQIDGIAYINDSFISTFKGLSVVKDEDFIYKIVLPVIPIALGRNEGAKSLRFKSTDGVLSRESIPMTGSQKSFMDYRTIPNRTVFYSEGINLFAKSLLPLNTYKATVSIVCAGNTDLQSELNLPEDALSTVSQYVTAILLRQRQIPKDTANDGIDN